MLMKYIGLFILASSLFFSCSTSEDPIPVVMDMDDSDLPDDPSPENSEIIKTGTFTSYAHNLGGNAILHIDSTGSKILRFENYTMSQGPDVHVYISKSNNYTAANVIEVTKLTEGFNDNDINFDFMSPAYTSEYKFVLVYCVEFHSLFGYAELM
jgi:Electron transfer DM13